MHVTITTLPVQRIVTVEMSEVEAEALRNVCQSVGGDPVLISRRYIDALDGALYQAGIQCGDDQETTGSTYFKTKEVQDAYQEHPIPATRTR